jgi:hypothetical protein
MGLLFTSISNYKQFTPNGVPYSRAPFFILIFRIKIAARVPPDGSPKGQSYFYSKINPKGRTATLGSQG